MNPKELVAELRSKLPKEEKTESTIVSKATGCINSECAISITNKGLVVYDGKNLNSFTFNDITGVESSISGITIEINNQPLKLGKASGDYIKFIQSLLSKSKNAKLKLAGSQNKSAIVDNNIVKIAKKKSVFNTEREKAIPIKNIAGVEIKKPGNLVVGFIQFQTAGGIVADSSLTTTGGAFSAVKDENSVVFADEFNYEMALKIKQYIESWSDDGKSNSNKSEVDEIFKLKQLLDMGAISQSEYDQKKKDILNRI